MSKFKPGPWKTRDGQAVVIFEVTKENIFGKVFFPGCVSWQSFGWRVDGSYYEDGTSDNDLAEPCPIRNFWEGLIPENYELIHAALLQIVQPLVGKKCRITIEEIE